jgi:hypothetical protein
VTRVRFSAWAQTGLGRAQEGTDDGGALGPSTFRPSAAISGPGVGAPAVTGPELELLAPGGVAGLDPGCIVRQDPPPGSGDVESNYLASIEFGVPELPWLATPAKAGKDNRLRPWLVLVVVDEDVPFDPEARPLPTLEAPVEQLPDLADSWAWAHVQHPGGDLGRPVARLLCPRMLAPAARYRACVVPAFAGGRAAGLADTGPATESHEPAWTTAAGQTITLPVYSSWTFGTALEQGDFEDLVRRLEPVDAASQPGVGARYVDFAEPWPGRPRLSGADGPQTAPVLGALMTFDGPAAGTLSDAAAADWSVRLMAQLDAPSDRLAGGAGDTGAVAPPIYGGRHVDVPAVTLVASERAWVQELNLGGGARIAAGLGAEYVRANQEALMAAAWQQVGPIREANRQRALAELATEAAARLHERHIDTMTPGELVRLTAPAAPRTRTGGAVTLSTEVTVSPLPTEVATSSCARLLRGAGPIAGRSGTSFDSLVGKGIRGQVTVPDPPLVLSKVGGPAAADMPGLAVPAAAGPADPATQAALNRAAAGEVSAALLRADAVVQVARLNGLDEAADVVRSHLAAVPDIDLDTLAIADTATVREQIASRLSQITDAMAGLTGAQLGPASDDGRVVNAHGVQIAAEDLHTRLSEFLAPGDRIAQRLASKVALPAAMDRPGLAPALSHPVFPAPMALGLLADAPEWFFPGVAAFPPNRASLLRDNPVFIESYMVGLNHEMMRELLWREYPTDQRGTPFARFWPRPGNDIPELTEWTDGLGTHMALSAGPVSVLLVRGDVVRRYPNMLVAASRALPAGADGHPGFDEDQSTWLPPLFVIPLDPSTAAFAFAIEPGDLRDDPGFFFVFQEHSHRMRFGFDLSNARLRDWNDLDWPRVQPDARKGFAVASAALREGRPENPGDLVWGPGADGAHIALIALQRPFRVAVHANRLIADG